MPFPETDKNKDLRKWFIFPDQLPTTKFTGYQSRYDETQNRGAFVVGQNVKMTEAQTPTLRNGYEVIGTEASDSYPVQRAWVYETRNGVQNELKAYDTGVYFYIWGVTTSYKLLKGGFTAAQTFGYGNIGRTSETTSYTRFCNGIEHWFKWSGAYATIASNTAVTLTKTGTTTWAEEGFSATGSIVYEGTEYAYTGGTGTTTLTGLTALPALTVGEIVVQAAEDETALNNYLGSVAMAHDDRMHSRLEGKKSVWNYSKLGDPGDYTTGSTDGSGGSKEVEFGGPIVAFGKLNKSILALKNRLIKILQFIQVGTRLDSPFYQTLIPVDDKSTTLGATNQKSTFSTPFGLVFVTPDKRMVLLSGVTANNEPQYFYLSDPIAQVFQRGVHDEGAGICVDNRIFYSFKSSSDSTYNDIEIQGNMLRQTFDAQGKAIPILWDTVNVGISCNDYTAIYNEDEMAYEVHRHSSLNSNSYRVINDKVDNGFSFTATVRSWAENFGAASQQKRLDAVGLEIKMLTNSVVKATVLFDQDGATGISEYTLRGTDTDNVITATQLYNPFGASPFGSQKIGSSPQQDSMQRYYYELELNPNLPFFAVSLQLGADTENSDFELIRFGYRLVEVLPEISRSLKKNTD